MLAPYVKLSNAGLLSDLNKQEMVIRSTNILILPLNLPGSLIYFIIAMLHDTSRDLINLIIGSS